MYIVNNQQRQLNFFSLQFENGVPLDTILSEYIRIYKVDFSFDDIYWFVDNTIEKIISPEAFQSPIYSGLLDLVRIEEQMLTHYEDLKDNCKESFIILVNKITELRRVLIQDLRIDIESNFIE